MPPDSRGAAPSLECELERIMDSGASDPFSCEEEPRKRPRRSVGSSGGSVDRQGRRPPRAPSSERSPGDARGGPVDEFLARAETVHQNALEHWQDAAAAHEQRAEDLRRTRLRAQEVAAAAQRLARESPAAESRARASEGVVSWLEDLQMHIEQPLVKNSCEDAIAELLQQSLEPLRRAVHLASSNARADAEQVRSHKDSSLRKQQECDQLESHAEHLSAVLSDSEAVVGTAEAAVMRAQERIRLGKGALKAQQDLEELRRTAQRGFAAAEEAAKRHEVTRATLAEHEGWTSDLQAFFQGQGVHDTRAIVRGLQVVLPKGDPSAVILHALLDQAPGTIDLASPHVVYLRDSLTQQLRGVKPGLQQELQQKQATMLAADAEADKATRKFREFEEQVRSLLADVAGAATPQLVHVPRR